MVAEGLARSEEFRQLVSRIESLDGLVYIRFGTDTRGSSAHKLGGYLSQTISHALNLRVLRITLTDRSSGLATAVLAHELQHAIEVLETPGVRTSADVETLFDRIGFRVTSNVMETASAVVLKTRSRDRSCLPPEVSHDRAGVRFQGDWALRRAAPSIQLIASCKCVTGGTLRVRIM